VRWSDIDTNRHVNYAAYIDAAGDLRYRFFAEHGYPPERFEQLSMGPIYTAIHAQFLREVRMGETITITYALTGLSAQGGRWKVHHDILKSNGKKAVSIDLRKPVPPTPDLLQTFQLIPRNAEFQVLPEMRRMS
jgi:acyl-CoA thioester hydrolase